MAMKAVVIKITDVEIRAGKIGAGNQAELRNIASSPGEISDAKNCPDGSATILV
jgi:hypothetical protein